MNQSEAIIINQALLGSEDAFRQIVQLYKDSAYTLAKTYVKESVLAEDIVQEAFVNAFFNLHSFKGKSKFSTWFFRIVINEAFKQKKLRERYVNDTSVKLDVSLAQETPQSELEEKEQAFYIQKALDSIKPNEALALRLFYLEDCRIVDVAKITGWTKSNVKVLVHRGRANLKKVLESYLYNGLITLKK